MAVDCFLKLVANGVDVDGGCTDQKHPEWIRVLSYSHNVVTVREASTGMASGDREYEPFSIVKRVDPSTPLILKALTNNEAVDATIDVCRAAGTKETYLTFGLTNARIASIKSWYGNDEAVSGPLETVQIVFQEYRVHYRTTEPAVNVEQIDSWNVR